MTIVKERISRVSYLQCAACNRIYSTEQIQTIASCSQCKASPLLAQYEFVPGLKRSDIDLEERSMWRYFEMLPILDKKNVVSLGEGWTPLLKLHRLAAKLNMSNLFIKDEGQNPTGSFKARGISMAVSKAKELGICDCIIPTAGNAGGALAAYCARAGMKATVVMPTHTPQAFKMECEYMGATLILVDGLIDDCAKKVAELKRKGNYFDVSTMKEPYRIEGKKTMGYELAEQFNWQLPDVILYPTGGGTGLIGIWKAFHEMIELGWISSELPRMIAVQSENCQPVVNTFFRQPIMAAKASLANGLAVPAPFAHKQIQQVLYDSGGTAVAIADRDMVECIKELASTEGMFVAPEGAALVAALRSLNKKGIVQSHEHVLLLNTGSAYKYLQNLPTNSSR